MLITSKMLVSFCLFALYFTDGTLAAKEPELNAQFYQPVDVDFELACPIDLSDTFYKSVAGPLGVVLVLAFTGILIAGLLQPKSSLSSTRSTYDDSQESRLVLFLKLPLTDQSYLCLNSWLHQLLYQMEAEEAFTYMGDIGGPCRKKILCYIHTFVPFAPPWLQTIFRVIRSFTADG